MLGSHWKDKWVFHIPTQKDFTTIRKRVNNNSWGISLLYLSECACVYLYVYVNKRCANRNLDQSRVFQVLKTRNPIWNSTSKLSNWLAHLGGKYRTGLNSGLNLRFNRIQRLQRLCAHIPKSKRVCMRESIWLSLCPGLNWYMDLECFPSFMC